MSEASSMDCRVGPRAWVIFADNGNCRMWTTFQPHIQKAADAEGLTVTPLFDQTAIDAAVAAERERVRLLELAEEGAKEAFGVVVQKTRDLEKEVQRLTDLLAGAHRSIREYASGQRMPNT